MNAKKYTLLALIAVLTGVAFYSMKGMLTPYVSFSRAMAGGEYVQIIGARDKGSSPEHGVGFFTFTLRDGDGAIMKVRHQGTKPLNFEHADQVVALGVYNNKTGEFDADKLLVKCPSKYSRENKQ